MSNKRDCEVCPDVAIVAIRFNGASTFLAEHMQILDNTTLLADRRYAKPSFGFTPEEAQLESYM